MCISSLHQTLVDFVVNLIISHSAPLKIVPEEPRIEIRIEAGQSHASGISEHSQQKHSISAVAETQGKVPFHWAPSSLHVVGVSSRQRAHEISQDHKHIHSITFRQCVIPFMDHHHVSPTFAPKKVISLPGICRNLDSRVTKEMKKRPHSCCRPVRNSRSH